MPRFVLGLFLAVLSVAGFASTFIVGAALTKTCHVSPEALAFLRFLIAGGVMAAWEAARPPARARLRNLARRDWADVLWLGPVGTTLMAWCVFMGCEIGRASCRERV